MMARMRLAPLVRALVARALAACALVACAIAVAGCNQRSGPPPVCPSPLQPPARSDVTAVRVPETNTIYVYGGAGANGALADLWRYGFGACGGWITLSPTSSPGPRAGQAAAFDSARHRIIYLGGGAGDVWSLDTDRLTFTKLMPAGTPPLPSSAGVAAYDDMHDRVVYVGIETFALDFSGSDQGEWRAVAGTSLQPPGDGVVDPTREALFVLDAAGLHALPFLTSVWHDVATSGDAPPAGARLTFDALDNRMLAVADGVFSVTPDANAVSATWARLATTNDPPARAAFAAVAAGDTLWLFGGAAAGCALDDLWQLSFATGAWSLIQPATTCQ